MFSWIEVTFSRNIYTNHYLINTILFQVLLINIIIVMAWVLLSFFSLVLLLVLVTRLMVVCLCCSFGEGITRVDLGFKSTFLVSGS